RSLYLITPPAPLGSAHFPYTTLFRSVVGAPHRDRGAPEAVASDRPVARVLQPLAELAVLDVARHPSDLLVRCKHRLLDLRDGDEDRKSTRLNSSHVKISYAVFCLKKK